MPILYVDVYTVADKQKVNLTDVEFQDNPSLLGSTNLEAT